MNRLEEFLDKNPKQDRSNMRKVSKRYQCQQCNEYTSETYINDLTMIIYWYCDQGHESKVELHV
jgi:hypothetical protein